MNRDLTPAVTETYERTMSGLLKRRQDLLDECATIRERMAVIGTDVEAIDRVLGSLGYTGTLEARPPRPERLMLFYRNELRRFIIDTLRGAGKPLTTRDMAVALCQTEGRDRYDRKLVIDITHRCSKAVRQMRDQKMVVQAGQGPGNSLLWRLATD